MTSSALLLSIIIIFSIAEQSTICCQAKNNVTFDCVPREKRALLRFKASIFDPSDRLSSWKTNYDDCCNWQGVECDKATRHVTGLHLGNRDITYDSVLRSERVDSSSLLELYYLSYLDLSGNDFQGSSIPVSLGSMKQLQHLNLSHANLAGIVPHQLGNLSSLHTLDLNSLQRGEKILIVDDLTWASKLASLEYFDLSHVDLSGTKDIIKVLSMLPSILVLRMSESGLDNKNLPHNCLLNSTLILFANVQHLDLSSNSLEGEFPCFIHKMTSLRFLDLSNNQYNSPDPSRPFMRLKNLFHLNLGDNLLINPRAAADWISDLVWDKCHLKLLNLGGNKYYGDLLSTGAFKNLSGCWIQSLETLDLSVNEFDGHLPEEIGELKQLKELYLYANRLSGPIPSSLGNLRALRVLRLDHNSLEGTLSEVHFANLSKLEYISGQYNMLKFMVGDDWVPPFQLRTLLMGSNKIGGQFPQWIQTQKTLQELYLWNCSIEGTLPAWLGSLMNLTHLLLYNNHFEGTIPDLASSVFYLDLSDNMINGSIPGSLCQMKGLTYLYISKNHLSGSLPYCWGNFHSLSGVSLSSNQLSGSIPNSIGRAYMLSWLHLDNNSFTGQLPLTLKNCTMLHVIDVGDNKLSGKLPQWIGNHLLGLKALRLRNNKFYGPIPSGYCQLSQLQIIDLANNNLTGKIPHCIENFSGMVKGGLIYISVYVTTYSMNEVVKGAMREYTSRISEYLVNLDLSSNQLVGEIPLGLTKLTALVCLNLSHNHLEGQIPENIGDMNLLESFDLSNNNLFGTIPKSLSSVTSLSYLNLSCNNLSGQIPTGPQLQTFTPSSYEGNLGLCGAPLLKKCHNNTETPPKVENDDDGNVTDKFYLYGFIITGIATGFWGYFGVLFFRRSWRIALFRHMDALIGKS